MQHDVILILSTVLATVAVGTAIAWLVRSRVLSKIVASYKFQLNDAGNLEADLTLTDGRVVSFVLSAVLVYDISNALLGAASRMGAKRPGMILLDDPKDAAPHNPLKRSAP